MKNWRRRSPNTNVLVHGYDTVDDRLVWGVLVANLPTLACQVSALLEAR